MQCEASLVEDKNKNNNSSNLLKAYPIPKHEVFTWCKFYCYSYYFREKETETVVE